MTIYSTCAKCRELLHVIDIGVRVHPCCDDGTEPSGNAAPNVRASAKWYAQVMNWRVFPLHGVVDDVCTCERGTYCPAPGMHSRIDAWGDSATTNQRTIDEWFTRWPDSNVAALELGFVASHMDSLTFAHWKPDRHGIIDTGTAFVTLQPSRRLHVPDSWFTILPPSKLVGRQPYSWLVPPSPKVVRSAHTYGR